MRLHVVQEMKWVQDAGLPVKLAANRHNRIAAIEPSDPRPGIPSTILECLVRLKHVLYSTKEAPVPKEIVRLRFDSLDPRNPASIASVRVGLSQWCTHK